MNSSKHLEVFDRCLVNSDFLEIYKLESILNQQIREQILQATELFIFEQTSINLMEQFILNFRNKINE